ncbi:unnamed protein product [Ilex paraguariensis]|uniref:Uncharacterized protein n=1 Tax=Ilex paraguariensis TaxID=185542 RepID=A0ABC8QKW8_9AQUA
MRLQPVDFVHFGIGPDPAVSPANVPVLNPTVVKAEILRASPKEETASEMRFMADELELALGKARLKKQLSEIEKERYELKLRIFGCE